MLKLISTNANSDWLHKNEMKNLMCATLEDLKLTKDVHCFKVYTLERLAVLNQVKEKNCYVRTK